MTKHEEDKHRLTDDTVELPVDGVLDLHTFSARDVKELLPEYLSACMEKGIFQVRVIHGKGTGVMRKKVRSILGKLQGVESFRTAGEDGGGWGATIVILNRHSTTISASHRHRSSPLDK